MTYFDIRTRYTKSYRVQSETTENTVDYLNQHNQLITNSNRDVLNYFSNIRNSIPSQQESTLESPCSEFKTGSRILLDSLKYRPIEQYEKTVLPDINPRFERNNLESDVIEQPETVISVALYHPIRVSHCMAEFEILGSQPLSVLRDKFYCPVDFLELEGDTYLTKDNKADEKQSSSYFLIENHFYEETRNNNALYSSLINKWMQSLDRDTIKDKDKFTHSPMSEVPLDFIRFKLEIPYLFVHQGNCCHRIIFKEVRIHSKNDVSLKNLYPRITYEEIRKKVLCKICKSASPSWITIKDELVDEDPYIWCHTCFSLFHYEVDGTASAKFEAFKFRVSHE